VAYADAYVNVHDFVDVGKDDIVSSIGGGSDQRRRFRRGFDVIDQAEDLVRRS